MERLLRVPEVAEQLGVGRATVYRRIVDGTIPAVRVGAGPRAPIRVDPADVASALLRVETPGVTRDGLLALDVVAMRIGKPVEWCLARTRLLPCVTTPHGLMVREEDLREWLKAAVAPVELRGIRPGVAFEEPADEEPDESSQSEADAPGDAEDDNAADGADESDEWRGGSW